MKGMIPEVENVIHGILKQGVIPRRPFARVRICIFFIFGVIGIDDTGGKQSRLRTLVK